MSQELYGLPSDEKVWDIADGQGEGHGMLHFRDNYAIPLLKTAHEKIADKGREIVSLIVEKELFEKAWKEKTLENELLAKKLAVAVEALTRIINPIECPACSMDDAPENVPCYCFEDFNNPRVIAKEALEKANVRE